MAIDGEPRVLLVRFGAIGNALAAVPAIRAIRAKWPGARIAMAADPVTIELLSPCPYIDEFIRYDHNGKEGRALGYLRFIRELRRRRFTHSVHFSRRLRSELIGFLSGAGTRVGFETGEAVQLITHKVKYDEGVNVVEVTLRLARELGIESDDRRLEYWPQRDSEAVEKIISQVEGSGPLVVIHPAGATQRTRLWGGFSELAGLLRDRLGARVVLIGSAGEKEIVDEVSVSLDPRPPAALGFSLPEAAELIRRADLFAGTDSGPAHLADAVDTPGAIVYAPHLRLDRQLAKWKPEGERFVAFTPSRDCADCGDHPCPPESQKRCADDIDPAEVVKALESLYAETGEEES